MKIKLLLLLSVVVFIFVFTLSVSAYDLNSSFPDFQVNGYIATQLATPDSIANFINDVSIGPIGSNNSTYIVFYVKNISFLTTSVRAWAGSGSSLSYTDYINFKLDYQNMSILTSGDTNSNFTPFQQMLNQFASNFKTIGNLQSQISTLNSTISSLQDELDLFEYEYNGLLSSYNDLYTRFQSLQSSYNALQDEFNDLQSGYNALQDDITNLEHANDLLRQDKADLQNAYNALYDEFYSLSDDYRQLEERFQNLKNSSGQIYNEGFNDGMEESDALKEGVISIFGAPMYVFGEVFDFEIFGLNFLSLIKFILTISIIGYVVLKLRS